MTGLEENHFILPNYERMNLGNINDHEWQDHPKREATKDFSASWQTYTTIYRTFYKQTNGKQNENFKSDLASIKRQKQKKYNRGAC